MVRDTSSEGGLPTCQICKACLERQKKLQHGHNLLRTHGHTDARTDRLVIIGCPPQSGGALIRRSFLARSSGNGNFVLVEDVK